MHQRTRDKGVRLHTHLAETKDAEAFCLDPYGMRPVELAADLGWLGDDVWYAHADLFVGREAPSTVFDPISKWLTERG